MRYAYPSAAQPRENRGTGRFPTTAGRQNSSVSLPLRHHGKDARKTGSPWLAGGPALLCPAPVALSGPSASFLAPIRATVPGSRSIILYRSRPSACPLKTTG